MYLHFQNQAATVVILHAALFLHSVAFALAEVGVVVVVVVAAACVPSVCLADVEPVVPRLVADGTPVELCILRHCTLRLMLDELMLLLECDVIHFDSFICGEENTK